MKMRLKFSAPLAFALILGLVALLPGTAFAQDPSLDTSRPIVGAPASTIDGFRATLSAPTPDGAGFASQGTWIGANKFTLPDWQAYPLSYDAQGYYTSWGASSPIPYFAQIDLEPGSSLGGATCFYRDNSATHDFSFRVARFRKNYSTSPPTEDFGTLLASGSSTGTPGAAFTAAFLSPAEIIEPVAFPILNLYTISAWVASDISFAGCLVYWHRTVSPAPATASFADVPISHPYFQFIEALKASGITTGCGTGVNYCPGDFVTRGQMAAFLAKGLGLTWPF